MYIAKHSRAYQRLRRPIKFFEDFLGKKRVEKIISEIPQRIPEENEDELEVIIQEESDAMKDSSQEELDKAFDRMMERYIRHEEETEKVG